MDSLDALAYVTVVGSADEVDLLGIGRILYIEDVDAALLAFGFVVGGEVRVISKDADVRDPIVLDILVDVRLADESYVLSGGIQVSFLAPMLVVGQGKPGRPEAYH